ncbi:MAG: hypothetical protein UH084_01905 [Paludibacteraceae bacterium]|nr:hypothetical protein [Paludibacteraceae bacterium]
MNWPDWIAIVISSIALIFSLIGYFKYDRPIKSLQKQDLEREALKYKRAAFEIKYIQGLTTSILAIQNTGNVCATNINVELKKDEGSSMSFEGGSLQYHIKQLEPTETCNPIHILGNATFRIKVTLTWDDESGEGISKNYYLERHG